MQISSFFRPEVLVLSAYHVPDASGFIKLDAMENPYQWSDETKTRWFDCLKDCALNRYPDPQAQTLARTIKNANQLNEPFEILLGNGSDELIQLLLMALPSTAHILSTTPSFVMYKQLSDSLGLNYHGVSLCAETFDLDLPAMLAKIETYQPALIFLAYPNNPTANLFNENAIETILHASSGLVVIDEAYEPFANASFMARLSEFDNLLVMRTVSKLGLAGLRLGYLVGHCTIIEQLNKIRLPYNINVLTQATVNFALQNKEIFNEQIQAICAERTKLLAELRKIGAFTVYDSAANFILFKTKAGQGTKIFASLKTQGVLIKNLDVQGGLLSDCLRVTVGKPHENSAFLTVLEKAIK